jgi:hypothetical protein
VEKILVVENDAYEKVCIPSEGQLVRISGLFTLRI